QLLLSPASPLSIRLKYLPRIMPWLWRFLRSSTAARVSAATEALHSLLANAGNAHRELVAAIGTNDLLVSSGWLKAYESTATYARSSGERAALQAIGVSMRELSRQEISDLVPVGASCFRHGTLYTDCAQITNP